MVYCPYGIRCAKAARLFGFMLVILFVLTACAKKKTLPVVPDGSSAASLEENSKSPAPLPKIDYTIQLGAFKSIMRAEHLVGKLQKEGIDAYFYEDKSGLTKVRFGRFSSESKALKQALTLKEKEIIDDFYIVHPGDFEPISRKDLRNSLKQRLVKTAENFIGIPYRWGGTSARKGFDCSGLTMTVYRLNGLDLPRKASSQYRAGQPVSREYLNKGDLVFFATNGGRSISHVGIYRGDNQFIHAPGKGKYIRISSLSSTYYDKHYRGARRYF